MHLYKVMEWAGIPKKEDAKICPVNSTVYQVVLCTHLPIFGMYILKSCCRIIAASYIDQRRRILTTSFLVFIPHWELVAWVKSTTFRQLWSRTTGTHLGDTIILGHWEVLPVERPFEESHSKFLKLMEKIRLLMLMNILLSWVIPVSAATINFSEQVSIVDVHTLLRIFMGKGLHLPMHLI